jgi:shikimate dehydrogenase
MPHKEAAARLATRRSVIVRRLGAANTLTFSDTHVAADNTDGAGLVADLRLEVPFEPEGRCCGVIGAGGAARAAIVALADAGAAEVLVVNRTPARAFQAAALVPGRARVSRPEELDRADLIVKATPVGMASDSAAEGVNEEFVDASRFRSGQLVVDLVYDPPVTDWLARAAASGARIRGGLGMLVHQAAQQVELWTGTRPPLSEMWRAVGRPVRPGQ